MSAHDDQITALIRCTALMAGSTALSKQGDTEYSDLLRRMSFDAHAVYMELRAKEEQANRISKHDRIVQGWSEDVPYARKRNPREKNYVHRVTVASAPDQQWLIENIRVPFVFEFEGEQIVYASRCPREAVAVKLRWG